MSFNNIPSTSCDISFLFICIYFFYPQEQKRWSTRPDSGTRNVSAALYASRPSAPRALYPGTRKFTAPLATRKSFRLDALSVTRYCVIQ